MQLSPELVLRAYQQGYFPMARGRRIYWLDPEPRAVFEWEQLHFSQRLLRRMRRGEFTVTFNQACAEVIEGCANREDTWLTPVIQRTYLQLHNAGFVHSVEAWQGSELAGGLYGVALGGVFFGESMFHRITDGSKAAFYGLTEHLQKQGYPLLDAQLLNDHTASLGATEIPRAEFHRRLKLALALPCQFVE